MGGDCLNVGCVPSKALLAASHAARSARHAARLGVHFDRPMIDWAGIRSHVHNAIAEIAPNDSVERYRSLGVTVLQGHARVERNGMLSVDDRLVSAKRIVIASGSRPKIPPIPGLEQIPFLTNETLFDLAEQPGHLLILGGGAIGLEMAQAHAGLGCKVSLLDRGAIAGSIDPQQAEVLREVLKADGVELIEHATIVAAEAGPVLVLSDGRRIAGTHLLVAAGRQPNTDGWGLQEAGLRLTAQGVTTDAGLRSLSHRHIYAAGDVADPVGIGPRRYTHVASAHAGVIIRRTLFRLPARLDFASLPRVMFTDPELAVAGLTEVEARAAGHEPRVVRWSMRDNDRAVTAGRTEGSAVLITSRRGALLGASLLSPHAGETIGFWVQAIRQGLALSSLAATILPYPTYSEGGKRAAGIPPAERLFSARVRGLIGILRKLP